MIVFDFDCSLCPGSQETFFGGHELGEHMTTHFKQTGHHAFWVRVREVKKAVGPWPAPKETHG